MLAKKFRLSKKDKIHYIIRKGEKSFNSFYNFCFLRNSYTHPRFAIIVSGKTTKEAVIRNKIRRQIYETIRLYLKEENFSSPYDIIFICKREILNAKYQKINQEIKKSLKKIPITKIQKTNNIQ